MALTATVGREEELDSIRAFIDAVPRGPTALSISGQVGIGKTVLWEAGVQAARDEGFRVLTCRSIEAEAPLSFAGLSELVNPVFEEVAAGLTLPRRRALEVALLLADPGESHPDPLVIGLAVFEALRTLGALGPCLIAVDDSQWLDSASATVLQIALKRLVDQPIGVLLTARDSARDSATIPLERCLGSSHVVSIELGALHLTALRHLLRFHLSLDLALPELERLHAMTDGNPFFALEVGREMLRTETRTAHAGAPRVPDSLRDLVAGRLARLPTETGDVLLEMAALARPTVDVLAAAHGDRDSVVRALDLAVSEGLVRLDESRVHFAHPLHASICYQRAPVWKRRAVHRALAGAVTDREERALHLARAAEGPDASIAIELDVAAESAAGRGAPAVGAEMSELAADLTPADPAMVRERLVRAATLHRLSGDRERAVVLLERVRADVPPGPERADVLFELAATRTVATPALIGLLDDALLEAAGDDARSSRILSHRSEAHVFHGDIEAALLDAHSALQGAERIHNASLVAVAIARVAHAEMYAADITPGLAERGVEIERSLRLEFEYLGSPRVGLARRLMRIGDLEEAGALLHEVHAEVTARGDERSRGQLLWSIAQVEWLLGRWTDALGHANEAAELNEQIQEIRGRGMTGRVKALIEADLGLVEAARASAEEGIAGARETSDRFFEISSLAVVGRLEMLLGNLDAAHRVLREIPDRLRSLGIKDPTLPAWPDAIEVLIATGDAAAARTEFQLWAERALALPNRWSDATTARCRGLLAAAEGDAELASASFAQSLRDLEGAPYPLERARTLLCMGAFLRQVQQRTAARAALEQALAIFAELGARLWAEKARAELARISGRRPQSEVLTETEHQVATLAGQGRTNKEIAASLHMGVSTVEAHLSSVYRKLDVRRAGLAARLAEAQ